MAFENEYTYTLLDEPSGELLPKLSQFKLTEKVLP
jgi:hypothetical protein